MQPVHPNTDDHGGWCSHEGLEVATGIALGYRSADVALLLGALQGYLYLQTCLILLDKLSPFSGNFSRT